MKEFKIISHATNNQQLWLCGGGGGVPLLCFRIYTTDIKTIIGPTWLFFSFFLFFFPPGHTKLANRYSWLVITEPNSSSAAS